MQIVVEMPTTLADAVIDTFGSAWLWPVCEYFCDFDNGFISVSAHACINIGDTNSPLYLRLCQ